MVSNAIFRDHPSPVCHIGVVSEGEYASMRNIGRKEGLDPRERCMLRCPCPLSISGETVDENDAA